MHAITLCTELSGTGSHHAHCNARMGAGESSPADEVVGHEYGFRVHRVEKNSPGEAAGLESILDYIVVANGVRLDRDDGSFVRAIQESKGKEMHLVVFNTHTLETPPSK